jgi:hypothetical protein
VTELYPIADACPSGDMRVVPAGTTLTKQGGGFFFHGFWDLGYRVWGLAVR